MRVRCPNASCERAGAVVEVPDIPVGRGIVSRPEPSRLHCATCGCAVFVFVDRDEPAETAVTAAPENAARPRARRK